MAGAHPYARSTAVRLSWLLAAGMATQAAVGLLAPTVYRDVAWIMAAWYGNDLVTLLVGTPLLVAGLLLAHRGSVRGELVWFAGLGYAVYNYGYYMYGAKLGMLFPLFVALFVAATWALLLALVSADQTVIAARFPARAPVRVVSAYAGLTGVGLTVAWLAQWAAYVLTANVPSIGEDPFRLVAAMDLGWMVPPMLVGSVLLWKRRPWGFVVTAIAVTQGAVYTLVLTVSSVIGGLRGLPGMFEQAPVWGVWTLLGAAAATALLASARTPAPPEAPTA